MKQTPESLSKNLLKVLSTKLEKQASLFIWCHVQSNHQYDLAFKLQNQLNSTDFIKNKKKIITVYSYDATIISAHTHIELMRKVPYLMTDNEIVESPLYQSSKNTTIYPSLYMQEDE